MIGPWTVSADIIEVCYVFAFSFGVLAIIGLSWSVVRWIWEVPARKRKRVQDQREVEENRRRGKDQAINLQTITNLEELQIHLRMEIDNSPSIENRTESWETMVVLTNHLRAMEFDLPKIGGEATFLKLHRCVSRLLTQVKLYGVRRVLSGID